MKLFLIFGAQRPLRHLLLSLGLLFTALGLHALLLSTDDFKGNKIHLALSKGISPSCSQLPKIAFLFLKKISFIYCFTFNQGDIGL